MKVIINWIFTVVVLASFLLFAGLGTLGFNVGLSWVSKPNSVQLFVGLILLFVGVITVASTILGVILALKNRNAFLSKFTNEK